MGYGDPVQLSPFRGCLSGSSELGWGSVELLRTSDGHVFCLIARLVLASATPWRFGYSMFGFSVALLPGAGGVSFAFVMVVTLCSGTSLLLGWRASLYRPDQRETNRNGRMLYPVGAVRSSWSAWGGASSAVCAVHIATGCSVKVGSSISVSFWLRMPGHGGAGSRSRNGLFCVPWAGCTRAVTPFLLCEEHAVILVIGGGCGASAHPCEASASGLWSLGSSCPSTRPVGGGAGPGLTQSCSPGPWAWLLRLSPAIRLPSMGWLGWEVCVCLHFLKCVCLISWKYWISFLRNLSFRLR